MSGRWTDARTTGTVGKARAGLITFAVVAGGGQDLLEELAGLWRSRIERIGEILAGPEEGALP